MLYLLIFLTLLLNSVLTDMGGKNSPLDYGSPYPLFSLPTGDPSKEYADHSPACESACLEPSLKVIRHFFEPGNIRENMVTVCHYYDEASNCHRRYTQCDRSMFETVTSGVEYMCKEQRKAFDVLIDCIDTNSQLVKKDCDVLCQPSSLVAGLALKDTVMNSLDQPLISDGLNMRDMIEPHLGKLFFSESCRITGCLMDCYKTKYNMLCEGSAGSILMEALVRPLSSESAPDASKFLSAVLGGLLPHSCSYLYSKNGGLRINSELDEEIRRMYKDRKPMTQKELEETLSKPTTDKNPFKEVSETFLRISPIESVSEKKKKKATKPVKEVEKVIDETKNDIVEETVNDTVLTEDQTLRAAQDVEVLKYSLKYGSQHVTKLVSSKTYHISFITPVNGTVVCRYEDDVIDSEGSGSGYPM